MELRNSEIIKPRRYVDITQSARGRDLTCRICVISDESRHLQDATSIANSDSSRHRCPIHIRCRCNSDNDENSES